MDSKGLGHDLFVNYGFDNEYQELEKFKRPSLSDIDKCHLWTANFHRKIILLINFVQIFIQLPL